MTLPIHWESNITFSLLVPLFGWYRGLGADAQADLDATLGFPVRSLLRDLAAHVAPNLRVELRRPNARCALHEPGPRAGVVRYRVQLLGF